jgi:hypothetical protein
MKKYTFTFFGKGKAVDIWSLPHLFFGVVAAIFSIVFGLGFLPPFLGVLGAALFWEWFEKRYLGVKESLLNRTMDCVLPLLAFVLAYQLFETVPFSHGDRPAILVAALLVFFLVNYVSWEARSNGEREFLG